ncbi:MAG: HD domain-containing protein [Candidatus Omnitrophica bacterium]|nr:HD domain-containing protein [Candidatus Omnitrophota bacterium]
MITVESFLIQLVSSFQVARIYTGDHPQFTKAIDKVTSDLDGILKEKETLTIAIVGDEFASDDQIFFDLSKKIKDAINFLKSNNVEKITFKYPVSSDDIKSFVIYLLNDSDQGISVSDYLQAQGILSISVERINASYKNPARKDSSGISFNQSQISSPTKGSFRFYQQAYQTVFQPLQDIISGKAVDDKKVKSILISELDALRGIIPDFSRLADRAAQGPEIHVLNVSVLSMLLASKLGFAKSDVLDIGLAGLLHDVGKMYISKRILHKNTKLNKDEFLEIKSHTVLGAQMLLNYVDVLGFVPVVAAFEHHRRFDGNGYPRLRYARPAHQVSLIVSICDVYDALNERRSYKQDYPPELIYELMNKERGKGFDPVLLDKFFKIMGVWPPSTIVSLSDLRVAIVKEATDNILLPVVEIVSESETKERIDLSLLKGKLSIKGSLNPLSSGKDYVKFLK